MQLAKRIIPCLDILNGQTVKGVNFEGLKEVGDPVMLSAMYADDGADELVLLDIAATNEKRKTFVGLVRDVARCINIPFTVGGGISTPEAVYELLSEGADKVSVNTAAVRNPALISDIALRFGSQCLVLAVDSKWDEQLGMHVVCLNGGRVQTGISVAEWIREGVERGAGEVLLTSVDHDGVRNGFALELTAMVAGQVPVPVIASGGAGNCSHFKDVFLEGKADAALAAGIFHNRSLRIPDLKAYLKTSQITVR